MNQLNEQRIREIVREEMKKAAAVTTAQHVIAIHVDDVTALPTIAALYDNIVKRLERMSATGNSSQTLSHQTVRQGNQSV